MAIAAPSFNLWNLNPLPGIMYSVLAGLRTPIPGSENTELKLILSLLSGVGSTEIVRECTSLLTGRDLVSVLLVAF